MDYLGYYVALDFLYILFRCFDHHKETLHCVLVEAKILQTVSKPKPKKPNLNHLNQLIFAALGPCQILVFCLCWTKMDQMRN